MTLGIEFREREVAAVLADEHGRITASDVQPGLTAASIAAAVESVGGRSAARAGIATRNPSETDSELIGQVSRAAGATSAPRVVTIGSATALAEQWCGAARDSRFVAALTATDCVHSGIVIDGRPFEGAHGLAGAAAWLALNPVERDDYRRLGCLESEIGAGGIVRRLVWRVKAGDPSRVADTVGGDLSAITVKHVFDGARNGDGVAIAVVRDTARYIGMAVGNLVAIVDPDVIVLGGLIADAADLLVDACRTEALRRVSVAAASFLKIVPGTIGPDAPALGAARAAMLER